MCQIFSSGARWFVRQLLCLDGVMHDSLPRYLALSQRSRPSTLHCVLRCNTYIRGSALCVRKSTTVAHISQGCCKYCGVDWALRRVLFTMSSSIYMIRVDGTPIKAAEEPFGQIVNFQRHHSSSEALPKSHRHFHTQSYSPFVKTIALGIQIKPSFGKWLPNKKRPSSSFPGRNRSPGVRPKARHKPTMSISLDSERKCGGINSDLNLTFQPVESSQDDKQKKRETNSIFTGLGHDTPTSNCSLQ